MSVTVASKPPMIVSIPVLVRSFDAATIARGRGYVQENRVESLQWSAASEQLSGTVCGNGRFPYRVSVWYDSDPKVATYESVCTCPVEYDCKHAVAALLTLRNTQTDGSTAELEKPLLPDVDKLDYDTTEWLNSLTTQTQVHKNAEQPQEILFYLLDVKKDGHKSVFVINTVIAKHLKKGGIGKTKEFYPETLKQKSRVTAKDLEIFAMLDTANQATRYNHCKGEFIVRDFHAAQVISHLLKIGRCHWRSHTNKSLQQGEKRQAEIRWVTQEDGSQVARCFMGDKSLTVLPTIPPLYIDEVMATIGQVNSGLPDNIAATLIQAPAVEAMHTKKVASLLQDKVDKNVSLPLPKSYQEIQQIVVEPKPYLYLTCHPMRDFEVRYYEYECDIHAEIGEQLLIAKLYYFYGDAKVLANETKDDFSYLENNKLMVVHRNREQETEQLRSLLSRYDAMDVEVCYNPPRYYSYQKPMPHFIRLGAMTYDNKLYKFHQDMIIQLEAKGWVVEFEKDYPYKPALEVDEWYSEIDENNEKDWFSLELGVVVDGERINLLPHLINAMQSSVLKPITDENAHESFILTLPQGMSLRIPHERIQAILGALTELLSPKYMDENGQLKITRQRATLLIELEKAFAKAKLRWFGGDKMLKLAKKLQNFNGIKQVTIPKTFKAELRHYQSTGVNWLQFLREYEFNGILADDMGLGKTVQALAHLLIEKKRKRLTSPALIVAPTSVIANWQLEAKRFAPELTTLLLHGAKRSKHYATIADYDLILTTYPLLLRDKEVLLEHNFHIMILDEAQYIKNAQAKVTHVVQQINANHRLCLTGTPLENHLGELWSLFHFLMPGLLGSAREFQSNYRTPIEKHGDRSRQQVLAKIIKPFVLRRLKKDVLIELPDKTEMIRTVELEGKQRDLYESIRLAMHKKVIKAIEAKGVERSQIIILDALLKLRQVCCDPRLVKLDAAKKVEQSAKLSSLMEMMTQQVAEGRRILLFSQFTSMLSLIEEQLEMYAIDYVKLTGSTKDRITPIETFQSGKVPVFLISLKAGGTGLNLTAADTVIHYDPWWNPAVENQATDRAHRIGQKQAVFVYKLVTKDTVEEKIIAMQAKKQALITNLLSGEGNAKGKITKKDFEHLLGN